MAALNGASACRRVSTANRRTRRSGTACSPCGCPGRRRRGKMFAASRSMAKPPDTAARAVRPAMVANDNRPGRPGWSGTSGSIPDDARAVVEPVPRPATSGRRLRDRWRVRFVPRWGPSIDPLTGWSGGGDPLASVELRFASRTSAEACCRRMGIPFESRGAPPDPPRAAAPRPSGEATPLCCWPTGPHPLCCGHYPVAGRYAAQNDDGARYAFRRTAASLTGSR